MLFNSLLVLVCAVVFSCQMCSLKHTDQSMFLKHVRVHQGMPNFVVTCPYCKKKLKSVRGFKSHMDENHRHSQEVSVACSSRAGGNHAVPLPDVCDDLFSCVPPNGAGCIPLNFDPGVAIGNLMMEIRYEHNVPASVSSLIAQRMGEVLKGMAGSACEAQQRTAIRACNRFRSKHKLNLFAKSIGFFQPDTIMLSETGSSPKATFQYISVKRQLNRLLQHGHLGDEKMASRAHTVQPNLYTNVWDGKLHTMSKEKRDIKLLLYYDDFQVANPLGPHASKMKIGALYFTIANFTASNRAKVRNIYLAALFHSSYVKRYGWRKILKPLIDDLKSLETQGLNNDIPVSLCAVVAV